MRVGLLLIVLVLAGCAGPAAPDQPTASPEPAVAGTIAPLRGVGYGSTNAGADPFWQAAEAMELVTWTGLISDLAVPTGPAHAAATGAAERGIPFGLVVSPFYQDSPGFAVQFDNSGQRHWRDVLMTFLNEHDVAWLGLGLEVNYWRELTDDRNYSIFVAWYDGVARNMDAAHPNLPMFPVFQYELLLGLHGGLWGGNNGAPADWTILQDFPRRDALGLTMYPSIITADPGDLGIGYWENLTRGEPLVIAETAWHAGNHGLGELAGSPEKQARYAASLRANVTQAMTATVSWTYAFDQPAPAPFESMGLHDADGSQRPAWEIWRAKTS